ncbi:MAG: type I secretion system permease/ATPase [Sphingomonadales bacterium]
MPPQRRWRARAKAEGIKSAKSHNRVNVLVEAKRRCRGGIMVVVVFSLAINLLLLAAPIYMLQVFDRVLTSRSVDTLLYLSLAAGLAFICFWALEIVRGWIMVSLGKWLDSRLSGDVLAASLRTGLAKQGSSIQPIRDVATVRDFLSGPNIFPILDAPWTPVFIAIVFLLHPILGGIGLGGAFLLFVFALANDLLTRASSRRASQISGHALEEAQSATANIDAIQAMGMMPQIIWRWSKMMDKSRNALAKASRVSGIVGASSRFVRQILQIGILGTGAWLVLGNELTPGGMIASSIFMGRALAPLEKAIVSWRTTIAARAAYKRLMQLLDVVPYAATAEPLPRPTGRVWVNKVTFAHPGATEPLLRNITFRLSPGDSLGLIGPTASGKSTLARALVGLISPQIGHARLDGADMAKWDPQDRGQYVGYLPQGVPLISGTERGNIARLTQSVPEQVYEAAKLAGIHENILALPLGYETQIGTGGMALSGGQRQRLGLARAVFGNPKLIVLDEPNANLDMAGENALVETLAALKQRRITVVIIAHRPSILRNIDKILVLRNGSIEMMGSRDEVFAQVTDSTPKSGQAVSLETKQAAGVHRL